MSKTVIIVGRLPQGKQEYLRNYHPVENAVDSLLYKFHVVHLLVICKVVMRIKSAYMKMPKLFFLPLILYGAMLSSTEAYPSQLDDYKYIDRTYASPGAHQLASFLASQLRPKEYIPPQEIPIIPYRLPVQGKRNSEVTNAIIGSEETQKMYRDGRK